MKILNNIIGLMAVLCVVDGAHAALRAGGVKESSSRVSSIPVNSTTAAARRLPTMILPKNSTSTSTSTSSDSSLMSVNECVDAYTSCIKGTEVCGSDFEECTTRELFYAKKPQCNSVLLQCTSAGINALFGTSDTTNLSIKNTTDGDYVYPTWGSILGQFIEAGEINNRLDKSSCVKRYTSCLKKENVCGEDFELCTSNTDFKKQRIYCESTLARCTDEGKTELFGSTNISGDPMTGSRLDIMITEGAGLASINATSTCAKVADQCILAACGANPYKCIINSSMELVARTDEVNDTQTTSSAEVANNDVVNAQSVSRYIKSACKDTIGGNKYCYMTANEGNVPTAKDLIDDDIRDEVYSDIYALRMNTTLRDKIQKMADSIDKRTKDTCSDTIKSCAMRSCGGGLGSACYKQVFWANDTYDETILINQSERSYNEIKRGCSSIVNTDPACRYAAAATRSDTYEYTYNDEGAFNLLFPQWGTANKVNDPIGVIEKLTGMLQNNYNPAAIAELKKKCRNTAVSCIRSMCGADFTGCYRNRTDIMTDTYDTAGNKNSEKLTVGSGRNSTTYDSSEFDKSMNKVGGVLDFTIVRGLCINTVKESSACDEHLKLEAYSTSEDNDPSVWGDKSNVREAWVDAVKDNYSAKVVSNEQVLIGCSVSDSQSSSCDSSVVADCDTMDENGCLYDKKVYQSVNEYQLNMAANTLFSEVLGDLELEAQAKYNQKLTKEQNMCVAANEGGIMGKKDMSSTYMWAKLKNKRVPKNYSVNGLKPTEFVASNDLYGSFCRARITIQSDDPDIQRYLQEKSNNKDWTVAYFAVGDVFTCGSWISQKDLEKIAEAVSQRKVYGNDVEKGKAEVEARQKRNRGLITAASVITGGLGTAYLADVFQSKNFLGGLWTPNRNTDQQNVRNMSAAEDCMSQYSSYVSALSTYDKNKGYKTGDGATVEDANMQAKAQDAKSKAYMAARQVRVAAGTIVDKGGDLKAVRELIDKNCSDEDSSVQSSCKSAVAELNTMCERVYNSNGQYTNYDNNTKRQIINTVAGVGGATLTGITAYKLTKSIQESNMTAEERAAYEAFMSEIGDHIYCFVGADEAGTYGDLIQLSID